MSCSSIVPESCFFFPVSGYPFELPSLKTPPIVFSYFCPSLLLSPPQMIDSWLLIDLLPPSGSSPSPVRTDGRTLSYVPSARVVALMHSAGWPSSTDPALCSASEPCLFPFSFFVNLPWRSPWKTSPQASKPRPSSSRNDLPVILPDFLFASTFP